MKHRMTNAFCALSLSVAIGATTVAANAGAVSTSTTVEASAPIILAQGPRRGGDRDGGIRRQGDRAYYHGHRGYRKKRPGYRRYNDFWFPLAAFGLGAAIGSSLSGSNSSAHVQWCYDHYRSYRAYDNTFQPYNGPRRPCDSPYG